MCKGAIKFLVCFLAVISGHLSFSQTDSLLKAVSNSKIDSVTYKLEMRLISLYTSQNDYPSAKTHAINAHKLAAKIHDQDRIMQSNLRLGGVYREMNQYDSAFTYLFKNVAIAETKKDEKLSCEAYISVGALFLRMKKYEKADFYYQKALKLKEGSNELKTIAEINSKLGTIHVAQKKYEEAIVYLTKAEKLIEGLKEPYMLANIYGNLGRINLERGNLDKAIFYLERTEKLGSEYKSDQILTRSYSFLSKVYLEKYKRSNSAAALNKALYYAELNFSMADRIEDDNAKCVTAEALYSIHKLKGNTKEALKFHEIYTALNDTLTQLENNKYVADINFKYETEKQERIIKEINLDRAMKDLALEVEKQESRSHIFIAAFIILAVILGGGLFFYSYKQKQQRALIQLENDKLIADMNFLKAQVDPHTIFNTINTIHGQLGVDVKSGKENLIKFSELMHYQLYECNDKYVDIDKEIQHLSKYIELQKLRKSGRMELEFNLGEGLNQIFVAPLLFIPLVENAFKYANTNSEGKYFIRIDLQMVNSTIKFNCVNSCTKKNDTSVGSSTRRGGGIGLDNLKKRLEAVYKNKYSLTINQSVDAFYANLEIHV